jgi:hypothetical protein
MLIFLVSCTTSGAIQRSLPPKPPINGTIHRDDSVTLNRQSWINLCEYIKQLEAGYEQ